MLSHERLAWSTGGLLIRPALAIDPLRVLAAETTVKARRRHHWTTELRTTEATFLAKAALAERTLATGVVEAAKKVEVKIPIVVRLAGTNADLAGDILKQSGMSFLVAQNLKDAAEKVTNALAVN